MEELNMSLENNLSNEIEIVWLDNPNKYRYLREGWVLERTPRKFNPEFSDKRKVIGYAVHMADGSRSYKRRYWYLMPYDADLEDKGPYGSYGVVTQKSCPSEAVVPNRIKVGQGSQKYSDYLWCSRKK
jgi:hypothetical protein